MVKIINILFWTIWVATFLVTLLRSFLFSENFFNTLELPVKTFILILGVLTGYLVIVKKLKKTTKARKIDTFFYILSATTISAFLVLKIVNRMISSEFILNRLYIQPNNLIWPALISLFPVAIILIPKVDLKKLLKAQAILMILVFLIVIHSLYVIYKSKWQAYRFVITHPLVSYEDKMRQALGQLSYDYAMFVVNNTPENATLLVPPQAFPWPSSGNIGYFRYFSYPRKLIPGEEFTPPSKEDFAKVDYVLLNWGETERLEHQHTHGWPKFDVKAEKVIFMNEKGEYIGETTGDYYYNDYKDKKVWGLIVVRH